jgi:type IV fimbrial biogenesis protein FimT
MKSLKHAFGFTKPELLIVIAIMGILASTGIPAISSAIPDYRLKNAVRDLYSNMQLAKLQAIRSSETYRIEFDTVGLWYQITDQKGTTVKRIDLFEYGSSGDIRYGPGNASKPAGGTWGNNYVSYTADRVTFNARGTAKSGYAYLTNNKGTIYAVGTTSTGFIRIKKWNGQGWE